MQEALELSECPRETAQWLTAPAGIHPTAESRADLAQGLGVSKVRVTQVLSVPGLAPGILKSILASENQETIRYFSEGRLGPVLRPDDPAKQVRRFRKLLARPPKDRLDRDN